MSDSNGARRRLLRSAATVAAVGVMPGWVRAAAPGWPAKPIRVIVPFAPGGGVDVLTRAVAAELSLRWKQPFVIENRAGAGSIIGADLVAKAPADGYTLLATVNQTLVANRFLYRHQPYDPDRSFDPVTLMVSSDQLLIANAALPANNLKEVIALARQQPGKLTYASYGNGSQPHLLYETIKVRENVDLLHVPYKGITPKLTALAAGEVMLGTGSVAVVQPLVAAGKIKPISVAGAKRVPQYPDVPTTVELGFPYAQTAIWYALFAPAGTPAAVRDQIHADVSAILADPAFAATHASSKGLTVIAGDGAVLARTIREETQVTAAQIKAAGVQPE